MTKSFNFPKNFLLGSGLMLLFLLPALLQQATTWKKERVTFKDPDDYANLYLAEEKMESGNWRSHHTKLDYPPDGRPNHWSSIPQGWMILGTKILQTTTHKNTRECLEVWAYWCNFPLLVLGAGLLCQTLSRQSWDWQAAAVATTALSLPMVRWASNFGHPDHHTWIIIAMVVAAAGFLEQKNRTAGIALGALFALSPISGLIAATGAAIGIGILPQKERSPTPWLWASGTLTVAWLLEYAPALPILRLDTASLATIALLFLIAKAVQSNRWATGLVFYATTLGILSLLWKSQVFTLADPEFRKVTATEGWQGITNWMDPLQAIALLPILLSFLIPRRRILPTKTEYPLAGMTAVSFICATLMVRAQELFQPTAVLWTRTWKKATIPLLLVSATLSLFALFLPDPGQATYRAIQKVAEGLPKGNTILANPTTAMALAYYAHGTSAGSLHWEGWPKRKEIDHLLREEDPKTFFQTAKNLGVQWAIFEDDPTDLPETGMARNQLSLGKIVEGITPKIVSAQSPEKTATFFVYQIP